MKHLIVGDNHGFHHNLRKLLVEQRVINKKGQAINRDEFRVYCTGDLIDGEINRAGDILNLQLMEEWFDAVCIGNHEYAFLGGRDFGSRRKHDRETVRLLLQNLDSGKLVPSTVVEGHLLTHAGLSEEFDFKSAEDANEFIHAMWDAAIEHEGTIAIFDWKNNSDYTGYSTADPTSGIFNLAWKKDRNLNFPQVVGHTIFTNGPIQKTEEDIIHYNIDVGAKEGKAQGGIIINDEDDSVVSVYWGDRKYGNKVQSQKLIDYPLYGDYDHYEEFDFMKSQRYSKPSKGQKETEDFLDSVSATNLELGNKLVSSWGEIWRVTKIDWGAGAITLKSDAGNPDLVKPMNSDWNTSFKRVTTIKLVEDDVKELSETKEPRKPYEIMYGSNDTVKVPVLDDEEVMGYFRAELAAL